MVYLVIFDQSSAFFDFINHQLNLLANMIGL